MVLSWLKICQGVFAPALFHTHTTVACSILILLVTNITEKERLEYKIISILRSPSIVAGLRLTDNFTFPFKTEVVLIATKLAIPNSVAISFCDCALAVAVTALTL